MSSTLVRGRWVFCLAGLALTAIAIAGAVWLWSRQTEATGTYDDGTPVPQSPSVLIEAVAPPRRDGNGEHPVARLARRSPQEAWRAAMALPESPDHERLRRFVAARWVEQAPGEALGAFEAMDEGRMPTEWMFEMLARWMAVDEESASDWAYNTAAGRPRVLMTGAIDWLLDHGEPHETALASAERMLRRWARRDPAAAWEVASANGLAGQRALLRGVAEVWFADNPRNAMDAAAAHSEWQILRKPWVAHLAGEWARAAPREAADWALALPPSSRHDRLLAAIHAPLSVVAPDEAHALAAEFGEGEARFAYARPLYEEQLRRLLGEDPRVLAEWLARQPDENLRASGAVHVAELFLKTDPDEALEWALGLSGKESANALDVVIDAIAEQDPLRAEDIVLGVSDPAAQAGAAGSFLGDWAVRRDDPAAAYEWSVENLSTTVRQEVHPGLFFGWAMEDPAGAMSALGDVTDANIRVAAFALGGMVWGIGWGGTPERLRERMLALDRLYQDVVRLAPEYRDRMRFASPEGDLPSYKLYHYWKDIDPVRAARYKERAEGYDGPTK